MPNVQASDPRRSRRFRNSLNQQNFTSRGVSLKKMSKMKVDPEKCMKTKGKGQNDRIKNGHEYAIGADLQKYCGLWTYNLPESRFLRVFGSA
jgi:hypothetical protein